MAEILQHPASPHTGAEEFQFPCGYSVQIIPPVGQYVTIEKMIFMLEDLKYHVLKYSRD